MAVKRGNAGISAVAQRTALLNLKDFVNNLLQVFRIVHAQIIALFLAKWNSVAEHTGISALFCANLNKKFSYFDFQIFTEYIYPYYTNGCIRQVHIFNNCNAKIR